MLETLYIQNFQAHSKLQIDFDSKVTTIVGPSDVGKSAVMRSIRWVCRNHPSGEAFIKDGKKGTTVRLIVDGNKIGRRRGQGQNTYLLNGDEFKAFGTDVPDRIAKILNTGGVNFQGQHDSPFWFAESAGEVSRRLNAVVDLGIIDDALTSIGKKVRRFYQEAQITMDRVRSANDRKEELSWVVVADVEFKVVEETHRQKDEIAAKAVELAFIHKHTQSLDQTRHRASSQALELRAVRVLGRDSMDVGRKRVDLSNLLGLVSETKKTLDVEIPDIGVIDRVFQLYNEVKTKREYLEGSIRGLKDAESRRFEGQYHKKEAEQYFSEQTKGELCPVCGQEF